MSTFASNAATHTMPAAPARETHPQVHGAAEINIARAERWIGGALAAGLAIYGLSRKKESIMGRLGALIASAALLRRSVTGHCATYEALGISTSHRPTQARDFFARGIHVHQELIVPRSAHELYEFWRNMANLPRFMSHLVKVEVLSPSRSRWSVRGPLDQVYEWIAEIISDQPGRYIAWRSVHEAGAKTDIEQAGSIHFDPLSDHQTRLRVVMEYLPPAGEIGHKTAQWFGKDPESILAADLQRFKSLLESGEILPQRPM